MWDRNRKELPSLGITNIDVALDLIMKLTDANLSETIIPADCGADALDVYKINYCKQTIYIKFYIENDKLIIVSFHKNRK